MKTSIVLFIYKRDNNFDQVIGAIRRHNPSTIFIVADGPKNINELSQINNTRALLESLIDWPCKIHKNYASYNLGLRERFRTGIDWVFTHTDKAIFIEDDCIPDPVFFSFCDELLVKYKDDQKILSISGNNFQPSNNRVKESYYFSRYPHVWGWATWKRVWDHYDSNIRDWPKLKQSGWLSNVYPDRYFIRKFWTYIFDRLYTGKINTWDYQLTYLSLKLGGFNIIPNVNLVKNVGYGEDATNIKKKNKTINIPTNRINLPLTHPKKITYADRQDIYIEELVYLNLIGKVSLLIKSILGII